MLYKQIEQNKRNTWIILGLYIVLLLAISVFLGAIFTSYVGIGFFIIGLIYIAHVYFDATQHLMKVTNAVEITKETEPVIYELVEELCLAGGLPMPKLYITPDPAPNAFATGRDPEHASLAITQGLLNIMDKKEVQGVIGHELSHIRNYDTRITVLASALTSLITMTGIGIVFFGWGVLTSETKGIFGFFIKILALIVIAVGGIISIIGIPLAKLLFLLVSRQREYLADIGSVDLTREPSGLISALSKLEQLEEGAATPEISSQDLTLQHLYFNFPNAHNWLNRLFSDHPPLDKRIERLKNSDKIN
ncbi:M48 family metallopeptidase [Lactobacillus johnsonii]|jgi:heat shock protein HtpX|uniref:Protease HtpX homolog n=1 Tax=Lactobacillus johnsonii (strain CNCM I-12250 / La1 / NCC 533) TaxID=257314 RepID=Q74JQ1_LACJO|nr:M48 family metallopeptidase [Lactobacillus johnsonii]AAS08878.1 probable protease htpX-like protein [Lactobacillus johnsonii NCC 533]MBF0772310.1 M48 family metallopeptidase [Lactobacillus johnsonii]MCI9452193.1 M48 family metallopeptidase [Lactobacillus johnsonii]MCT3321785.1 protease [Lactobacillus johnsonii]MCT3340723.1 protease [Lactobacillus johnsonii]